MWGQGAQAPNSVLSPWLPQLACGVLWFSGYGPIWLQSAADLISSLFTLLQQLGPTVSELQGAPGQERAAGGSPVPPTPRWGL